jgi:hypothetical protein
VPEELQRLRRAAGTTHPFPSPTRHRCTDAVAPDAHNGAVAQASWALAMDSCTRAAPSRARACILRQKPELRETGAAFRCRSAITAAGIPPGASGHIAGSVHAPASACGRPSSARSCAASSPMKAGSSESTVRMDLPTVRSARVEGSEAWTQVAASHHGALARELRHRARAVDITWRGGPGPEHVWGGVYRGVNTVGGGENDNMGSAVAGFGGPALKTAPDWSIRRRPDVPMVFHPLSE